MHRTCYEIYRPISKHVLCTGGHLSNTLRLYYAQCQRELGGRAMCTCPVSGLLQESIQAERSPCRVDWKSETPRPQSVMKAVRISWLLANSASMALVPQSMIWTGATSSGSATGSNTLSGPQLAYLVNRQHTSLTRDERGEECCSREKQNVPSGSTPFAPVPKRSKKKTTWPKC